jgi:hypothetical protein
MITSRRKTEELGEKYVQCHFVHHKSHMDWPWLEPGPPWREASDQHLEPWHCQDTTISICDKEVMGHVWSRHVATGTNVIHLFYCNSENGKWAQDMMLEEQQEYYKAPNDTWQGDYKC